MKASDPDTAKYLKEKWNKLKDEHSAEELKELYKEGCEEVNQSRETRKYGTHNHALSAFHDACSTIAGVEHIVSSLISSELRNVTDSFSFFSSMTFMPVLAMKPSSSVHEVRKTASNPPLPSAPRFEVYNSFKASLRLDVVPTLASCMKAT